MRWQDFLALAHTLRDVDDDDSASAHGSDPEDADADADFDVDDDAPSTRGGKAGKTGKNQKSTKQQQQQSEIDHAFALFTTPVSQLGTSTAKGKGKAGSEETRPITLADLKRVARELREEVDDKVLKLMIEEANGQAGAGGLARGVGREDFEGVMKRAGVFG